jgi:hypothetical protein
VIKSHRHGLRAALIPALAAAVIGSGALAPAASAATAATAPWGAPAALSGTADITGLLDLKVAADGSAVALWYSMPVSQSEYDLYVSVRPAGSSAWGAAHSLDVTPIGRGDATLLASPDGTVTAAWTEFPNDVAPYTTHPGGRLLTAVLAAGGSTWSDPVELDSAATWLGDVRLAEDPKGGLATAVWTADTGSGDQIHSAVRERSAGAWSAAERLDVPSVTGATARVPQVAVDQYGTTTVAYTEEVSDPDAGTDESTVRTVTRPLSATAWGDPVTVSDTSTRAGSPRLGVAVDGDATLVWHATDPATEDAVLASATRPASTGVWGAIEPVTGVLDDATETTDPLIGPTGDVTVLWVDYTKSFGTRTTTRSAATGTWSAVRTLSTQYVPEQFDATIDEDGTVQAVWTQDASAADEAPRVLVGSAMVDGVWTALKTITAGPTDSVYGQVAVAPDGRATAAWAATVDGDGIDLNWRLSSASTIPVAAAPAVSGTVRTGSTVTCKVTWSGATSATSYAWLRDGKAISGATAAKRRLTGADYSHQVACRASAANEGGTATATSVAKKVAAGPALTATTKPSITGTAKVGKKLTAKAGKWSPAATSYGYQWKRGGASIKGATKPTYKLVKADKGKKVTVTVTAKLTGYANGSATSTSVKVSG